MLFFKICVFVLNFKKSIDKKCKCEYNKHRNDIEAKLRSWNQCCEAQLVNATWCRFFYAIFTFSFDFGSLVVHFKHILKQHVVLLFFFCVQIFTTW